MKQKYTILFFMLIFFIPSAYAVNPQIINIPAITGEATQKYNNVAFTSFNISPDNYVTNIKVTIGSATQNNSGVWSWLGENYAASIIFENGFQYTALYDSSQLFNTKYYQFMKFNGTNSTGANISGFVFSQNASKFLLFKPKPEIHIDYNIDTGITTYEFQPTIILTFGGLNKTGDFLENTTDFYTGMPSQSFTVQSTQLMSVEIKLREKNITTITDQINSLSSLLKLIYKLISVLLTIVTFGRITDSSTLLYFLLFLDTLISIMIFFIELFIFKFYLVLMYIIIIGNFWCANRCISLHSLLQEYKNYYKGVIKTFYILFTYIYGIILYLLRLIRG